MLLVLQTSVAYAANDLVLPPNNIHLSAQTLLEGRSVRVYATVQNVGSKDLLGYVRFFDNDKQVSGDQPISVVAVKDDTVFVDWNPTAGEHTLAVRIYPYDKSEDNPANNVTSKQVTVLSDTDRDGIPNENDPDDDNDTHIDSQDTFPLDKTEWLDSDGDTIGDNKDPDDDNDGVIDSQDDLPLDASESVDTDKDRIGNNADTDDDNEGLSDIEELSKGTNSLLVDTDKDGVNDKEDAFPLDPTQTRDYDRDGVSDEKDQDADNDGIPKAQDKDDVNIGPEIEITSENNKQARFIVFPDQIVIFDSGKSVDPDGTVASTLWLVDNQKIDGDNNNTREYEGQKIKTTFRTIGQKSLTARVTDNKGESREKTFTVYVVPASTPYWASIILIIILSLAFWGIWTYSRRRKHSKKRN